MGHDIKADTQSLEELATDADHGGMNRDVLSDFVFGWREGDGAEHPTNTGACVSYSVEGGDAQELFIVCDEDQADWVQGEQGKGEAGAADSAEAVHEHSSWKEHANESELIGDLRAAADLVVIEIEFGSDKDGKQCVADHPTDAIDHVRSFVASEDGVGFEHFASVRDRFDDALPERAAVRRSIDLAAFAENLEKSESEQNAQKLGACGKREVVAEGGWLSVQPLTKSKSDGGASDHGAAGDDAVHAATSGS